jgi:hypothetical protein
MIIVLDDSLGLALGIIAGELARYSNGRTTNLGGFRPPSSLLGHECLSEVSVSQLILNRLVMTTFASPLAASPSLPGFSR